MTIEYQPLDPQAHREEQQREREIKEAREASDIQWLMSDERGRRLMRQWLELCGTRRTPWSPDPHLTSFQAGAQNVGLMLESAVLTHAPDAWAAMMAEGTSKPA